MNEGFALGGMHTRKHVAQGQCRCTPKGHVGLVLYLCLQTRQDRNGGSHSLTQHPPQIPGAG